MNLMMAIEWKLANCCGIIVPVIPLGGWTLLIRRRQLLFLNCPQQYNRQFIIRFFWQFEICLVSFLIITRVAVDEDVRIHVRVVLMMAHRFHRNFIPTDVVAALRKIRSRTVWMTLLMTKFGRQTDGDANHQDRSRDATGDAQHRTQIRRFHYDWNRKVQVKIELIADDTIRTNGRWEHCKSNFDCQFKRRTSIYFKKKGRDKWGWMRVECPNVMRKRKRISHGNSWKVKFISSGKYCREKTFVSQRT